MRFLRLSVCLAVLLASLPTLWAQSPEPTDETQLRLDLPEEAAPAAPQDIGIWDFVRMLLVLSLMVGLIWGFVIAVRRFTRRPLEEIDGVRLLSTFTLAPNRSLYFVEIGNRVFVLTGAENGIQTLTELDDQVLIDSLRLRASQVTPPRRPFRELLERVLAAFRQGPPPPPGPSQVGDYLKKQRERLQKLS